MNHIETGIGINHEWELDIFLGRTGTVGIIRGLFREHDAIAWKRGMDGDLFFPPSSHQTGLNRRHGALYRATNRHGTMRNGPDN